METSSSSIPPTGYFERYKDEPRSGKLCYDKKEYHDYVVVNHRPNANDDQFTIARITGTSDCFPALDVGYIPFRVPDEFLMDLISNEALPEFRTKDHIIPDHLKSIFRDIGLITIYCKEKNFEVDFSRVSLNGIGCKRVKAIPVQVSTLDFNIWKQQLRENYTNMVEKCSSHEQQQGSDYAFQCFLSELDSCSNMDDMNQVFKSHYFWSKYTKYLVLSELRDLVKTHPGTFYNYLEETTDLAKWPNLVQQDKTIGHLFQGSRKRDISSVIDDFLVQLRSTLGHFSKSTKSIFTNVDQYLEYLEKKFPKIMEDVYKVSRIIFKEGIWSFKVLKSGV